MFNIKVLDDVGLVGGDVVQPNKAMSLFDTKIKMRFAKSINFLVDTINDIYILN